MSPLRPLAFRAQRLRELEHQLDLSSPPFRLDMSSPTYGAVEAGEGGSSSGGGGGGGKPRGKVDWDYSHSKTDILTGTGSTTSERLFTYLPGIIAAILVLILYFVHLHKHWNWWRLVVAMLIAFDIIGGTIGLSTNANKRFYHTPPRPEDPTQIKLLKNHIIFSLIHVHPLLIWLLYKPHNWIFGVVWYVYLLVATAVVEWGTKLYLKRPCAMGFVVGAVFIDRYLVKGVEGFEWLPVLLVLKIVYGLCVQEEPYRPEE